MDKVGRDPRMHPAHWARGKPGDTRYICPFCNWFVDISPGEPMLGYMAGPVLRFGSRCFDRTEFVEKMLEQHIAAHVEEMATSGAL
jgi:hypothetical protein